MRLHLIRHAHLISDIRGSNRVDPMFDYSNVCYWRDMAPRLVSSSDNARLWATRIDQLVCRSLVQIVRPSAQDLSKHDILPGSHRDVERDALDSCRRYIHAEYERVGFAHPVGSFLDALDLIAAAVVYICLLRRAPSSEGRLTELTEVVHKASTLITQTSSRFPAFGNFQRLLLTLSSKVTDERVSRGPLDTATGMLRYRRRDVLLDTASLKTSTAISRLVKLHTPYDSFQTAPVYRSCILTASVQRSPASDRFNGNLPSLNVVG